MDLTFQSAVESDAVLDGNEAAAPYVSVVDPFLVEALQNPRHRLTILRMEMDIQKFLQNSDKQQFEFPHFPTSYLRLAAHRVSQHYGLLTMVQDNAVDAQGSRILVTKKPDSKFPAVYLSDVPAKMSENDKLDQKKIVIRSRPKTSSSDANHLGQKRSPVRSVEERKEEYARARARIFSSPSSPESEDSLTPNGSDGRGLNANENEVLRNYDLDGDRNLFMRDMSTSRVAILRDREKDRTDPDYDRSYNRYVRNIPNAQSFNTTAAFNMPKFQPPFVHFPHPAQMAAPPQAYRTAVMSPYNAVALNHTSGDALYMQWPTQSMMYAHSYDQLRQICFQAPFCQQPLSFDYSQNHR